MRILGQSIAAMTASAHPLRLVASLAEASHGSLQDRTLGSLRVSSEGHTVSSIHLSGRRQLAWRTERTQYAACDRFECSSQAASRLALLGFNAARPPAFRPRGTARSVGVDSLEGTSFA